MSTVTYSEDMQTVYVRINWQNQPSTSTALGATNLNKIDLALSIVDGRVVALNTTKLDQSVANTMVQDVTFENNGVFTIKKLDGTTKTYDPKLEKLAVNFEYDVDTQRLVITLNDGTKQYVDMSALITEFEFLDSSTIAFTKNAGKMSANIKNGSVTEEKLQPNFWADIKVQSQNASNSAAASAQSRDLAKRYAIGGVQTGDAIDNAKYYMEQARIARDEAEDISNVGIAEIDKLGLVKGNGNVEVRSDGAMWANPYADKVSNLSSTFITCPTSDDGLVHINKIEGETVQKVTIQGKNLFNGVLEQGSYNNSTGVKVGSANYARSASLINILPNRTYKFSNSLNITTGNLLWFTDNGTLITTTDGFGATSPETAYKVAVNIYRSNGIVPADITWTQLELGSTSTQYEPFTPNSPSPEYPSSLKYAKDFDVKTSNKNLFDGIFEIGSYSQDTGVKVNDTNTIRLKNNIKVVPSTTYSFSSPNSSISRMVWCFYDSNGSFIRFDSTNNTKTVTVPSNCYFLTFRTFQLDTALIEIGVTKLQFEIGTETTYASHKEDKINISFPFMSVPLAKNSLEYDVSGKFTKRTRVKEVVFNGTETFALADTGNPNKKRFNIPILDVVIPTDDILGRIICSHFKNVKATDTWNNLNGISVNFNGRGVHIYCEEFATWTGAQFKAWVKEQYDKGTPLTIQYQLANTIVEEFEPIHLKSYKGTTHLFTNSSPQVTMTADFKSELWSRDYLQDVFLDKTVYMGDDSEVSNPLPTDSDLLGGQPKSYFESLVNTVDDKVNTTNSNVSNLMYNVNGINVNTGLKRVSKIIYSSFANLSCEVGVSSVDISSIVPQNATLAWVDCGNTFLYVGVMSIPVGYMFNTDNNFSVYLTNPRHLTVVNKIGVGNLNVVVRYVI